VRSRFDNWESAAESHFYDKSVYQALKRRWVNAGRLLISNSAVGVATIRAQSCSLLLDEMRDGLRVSSYFAADL
jgi:hypothetical protein